MLRFCIKSAFTTNRALLQSVLCSQIDENVLRLSCCKINILRHYSNRQNENVDLEKIYDGPLTPKIKGVKVLSLASSVLGLVAQPVIIKEASTFGSMPILIAICTGVGFFTFVTPILLHYVTKKYVTEIHYDPKTFTYHATTISFFLRKKQHIFKVNDIEVPEIPGMFTTMNVNKTPLFIEARFFNDPTHYARMMGYDKPMDFKFEEAQETTDSGHK